MADKHLTELEWKRSTKGKGLKDGDLCKAMAALDRAKSAAEEQAALEELGRQSQALRKAAKNDEAVTDYLDQLDKAQAKQLQSATLLAKADAKKASTKAQDEDESGEDEDEGSPVALTKGLVALLRQVKQGVPLHAMIATDGKQTAVMLSKKALSVAKSKILKEHLGVSAIKPPILAQCIYEANAVTFVVAGPVSGLAKKIKGALLAQTEVRHKVRVRGEDADDVDEDVEGEGATAETEAEEVPIAPPEPPKDPAAAQLTQAMAKLAPAITRLVAARPDVKAGLLQSVARFQGQIKQGDVASARNTLFEAAALVKRLEAQLGEGSPSSSGKVKFEQVHLDWDSRKQTIESRLAQLNQAILADGDIPEGPSAAAKLSKVLERFNEGLGDTLDELRNAGGAAERKRLGEKAQGIADRYLAYLASDALVAHIEDNPYEVAVDVRGTLSPPLVELKSQLQALA